MKDLSVRGVYRRYVVEPRIAFFGTDDPAIVGDPKNISIAKDILGSSTGLVRPVLEPLAFKRVGPATWWQNVCDNIKGAVSYSQTWTHIDVRIVLAPDSGIAYATMNALRNSWKVGIEGTWNNPAPTLGGSPKPWKSSRLGEAPCRVSVLLQWVEEEDIGLLDHVVWVHAGNGATDESNWYTNDPGSTAAHEFGHMLGLPDEYPQSTCSGRAPVNTGTIMDNNSNFIPQRSVQWIADEIGSDLK
jgi:hypothetical protein